MHSSDLNATTATAMLQPTEPAADCAVKSTRVLMATIRPVTAADCAIRLALGLVESQAFPLAFAVASQADSYVTMRILVWMTLMWQVPLRLQLKLMWGELLAVLFLNVVVAKHLGTPITISYISRGLLSHILFGVCFPAAIAAVKKYTLPKSFFFFLARSRNDQADSAGTDANTMVDPKATVPGGELGPTPYTPMTRRHVVSVKVCGPDAFQQRAEIIAAVEGFLTQQDRQSSGRILHIKTAAWEGSLQLLVTIVEELPDMPADPDKPVELQPVDLQELMCMLPACLGHSPCLIHSFSDRLMLVADNGASGAAVLHETGKHQHGSLGVLDGMAPFCLTADDRGEITVQVKVNNMDSSCPVEVVACFQKDGGMQVRKLKVDACQDTVRLELPSQISSGPVSIHAISTKEGQQGAILGSLTTMALPQPVAQELSTLFDSQSYDAELSNGFWELLEDMAAWNSNTGDTSEASGHVNGYSNVHCALAAFFQGQRMLHCLAFVKHVRRPAARSPAFQAHANHHLLPAPSNMAAISSSQPVVSSKCMSEMPTASSTATQHCIARPVPTCGLREALSGFADRAMEQRYDEYRGSKAASTVNIFTFVGYLLMLVMRLKTNSKLFICGSLWRSAADVMCAGVYALMLSPWKTVLARHRLLVLGITRGVASWSLLAAICFGTLIPYPVSIAKLTSHYMDIVGACIWFALANQMQMSKWLLPAVLGDALYHTVILKPTVGLLQGALRAALGHGVALAIALRTDILARQSFLRRWQPLTEWKEA